MSGDALSTTKRTKVLLSGGCSGPPATTEFPSSSVHERSVDDEDDDSLSGESFVASPPRKPTAAASSPLVLKLVERVVVDPVSVPVGEREGGTLCTFLYGSTGTTSSFLKGSDPVSGEKNPLSGNLLCVHCKQHK